MREMGKMTDEEKDKKIAELEERLKEVEIVLAWHFHSAMGDPSIGEKSVWFKSMGTFGKE